MGRCYSVDGQDTNTAATSILGLTSASTVRPKIYLVSTGSDATADAAAEYNLQRYTVAGTSTAVTPQGLDPGDPASLASSGEAHSVEPTYTANAIMFNLATNQRQGRDIYFMPGREIILPATAANGVGVQVVTVSATWNAIFTFHYEE